MKFTLSYADILKKLEKSGKLKEIQEAIKEKNKSKEPGRISKLSAEG